MVIRLVPPYLFVPLVGMAGLSLVLANAHRVFGLPLELATLALVVAEIMFVGLTVVYMVKIARQLSAFGQDFSSAGGRAALSAATGTVMLFATASLRLSTAVASVLLVIGLTAHAAIAIEIFFRMVRNQGDARWPTPAWDLNFVGFIIATAPAVVLGWRSTALASYWVSVVAFAILYPLAAYRLIVCKAAPSERPSMSIHFAPIVFLAGSSKVLGYEALELFFTGLALAVGLLLLARIRFLTSSGLSPAWGAFTFPLDAATNLFMSHADQAGAVGQTFRILSGLALIVAVSVVPALAFAIFRIARKTSLPPATVPSPAMPTR